jgi:hypothetical protein
MPRRHSEAADAGCVTDLERRQSNCQMGQIVNAMQKASWFKLAWKSVALVASTGAAFVTVFSALHSYGVIGNAESHKSIGNIGAAWVGLRPAMDTASAIGDTVHYVATIADANGSILVGAQPTWTTGDSTVAVARQDGAIIGRRPGQTTVSVVVGALVAHSRIVVKQRVATVDLPGVAADSVVVAEGAQVKLQARALDSRGHAILNVHPEWQVEDSSVAALDSTGMLSGHNAGHTAFTAKIDGVTKHASLYVVTTAANLVLVAGTNQRALAGSTLPQAVVVRATSKRGAASSGQVVRFRLSAGQGTVTPATMMTDADGRARATWTLGDYPGRQTLFASVDKVDSALAIVAEADPVASNTRVAAVVDNFVGKAGEPLADSVAVRVSDSTGRVLADVPVRWTSMDGGTVEGGGARTDSLGVVRARWTLAKKTGTQRLRAQVGGGSGGKPIAPVTIIARAMAGAPTGIVVVSGDGQRGAAGSALSKPVVLRVVDANGSGVADAALVLSPSGGSVPDSSVHADSNGVVRARWTLGHSAGDYTLAVKMDGVKKLLKVAAHAVPAAPANLSFDDAPANGKRAHGKGKQLYALVTDVYGNPVPDAKVNFSAKSGTVTPARAATDAQGRAAVTWVPGTKGGEQRLVGAVRSTDVRGDYSTGMTTSHDATVHVVSDPKPSQSAKKAKHSR